MLLDDHHLNQQLTKGCTQLGLSITQHQHQNMMRYLAMMQQWNNHFNLTAIVDSEQMISKHLLDSLTLAPWLARDDCRLIADIGTGAGLPGLVLAMFYPDKRFYLLDSNGKKTRFCNQVKAELGLNNVKVYQQRAEQFRNKTNFDCVISRAFGSLLQFVTVSRSLLAYDGCWLAMKGRDPLTECANLPADICCKTIAGVVVPGVDAARHIVHMTVVHPKRTRTREPNPCPE